MPTFDGFLTVAQLGMFPVDVLLCFVVVAYTKGAWKRIPNAPTTQAYAWLVAALIVAAGQIVNGANAHDPVLYIMGAVNGLVVALAAGKAHDMTQPVADVLPATLEQTAPAPADSAPNTAATATDVTVPADPAAAAPADAPAVP